MPFSPVFESFVKAAPFCVMTRSLLVNTFSAEQIDRIFEQCAERQSTRELLFSTVTDLMCDVVLGVQPSIHAAFQEKKERIPVAIASVYNKLNGVEVGVCEQLVARTGQRLATIVRQLGAERVPLLRGYRSRILDGNHLSGTEHRIEELRYLGGAALPGKSLVVYEPALGLMTDLVCCQDGHAQERSLLPRVLELVEPGDLWIEDRNFCTLGWVLGVAERGGSFLVRQHKRNVPWKPIGKQSCCATTSAARVYEQTVLLGRTPRTMQARRISIELAEPTCDGETKIHLLTNLPQAVASATKIAELYRRRWMIETAFADLTRNLHCEIATLGYPPAALFGFSLAVIAYNILAVTQAAVRAVYGRKVDETVSGYFIANEVVRVHDGMLIAVPGSDWQKFESLSASRMATILKRLAKAVRPGRYPKSKRGRKKPPPKRTRDVNEPHLSTYQILQERKEAYT